MYNWAKANMSKLKQPTKAQKKIFEKYKAMKAAGDTPANPKPRPKAQATPSSKPASKPAQSKPTAKTTPKPAQSKPTTKLATGSGVQGKPRPVGSPGPNVTKPYGTLDRSGARVRRNLQDAQRSRTAASAEVRAAGGSRRRSTAAIDREVKRNERYVVHNVAEKNVVVVHGDVVCNATVVKCFPVNTTKTNGKTYLQSSRSSNR